MTQDSQMFRWLSADLTEQISLIKAGEVKAAELAAMQAQWVTKVNPKLNAFISVNTDTANIATLNTELGGVSIGIKDNIDVVGMTTTAGLETRRHRKPSESAFVVERLLKAGAHINGKLNMHEGALGASNHNSHYGNCYNPFDLSLTPGGSSGGSASAVAACLTAAALGTDTMGSVRIPAAYCGLFGYKPSKGAVSNRGSVTCSRQMDSIGPITRSARDLKLIADILIGFDANSAYSSAIEFSLELPERITLLVPDDLAALGIEESIIADFEQNLSNFVALGCNIVRFSFKALVDGDKGYDFGAARRAGLILCEADMRVEHAEDWAQNYDKFSPYLQQLLSFIDSKSPMDVVNAERVLEQAKLMSRQLFAQGDFLLLPTTPQRAFPMTEQVPANQADLTSFANQAGLPAVSMPMLTKHALPAGMQLVGPHASDYQLLEISLQWQQLSGYRYTMPSAVQSLINQE